MNPTGGLTVVFRLSWELNARSVRKAVKELGNGVLEIRSADQNFFREPEENHKIQLVGSQFKLQYDTFCPI